MRALSTLPSRRCTAIGTLSPIHASPPRTSIGEPRPSGRLTRARRAVAELPPDAVEQVARRVVELLRHDSRAVSDEPTTTPDLVDAGVLARHLGLTRTWVYENAAQLGAIPVGDGPRPRLRFDLETAIQAFRARRRPNEPIPAADRPRPTPTRRRPSTSPSVPLLPIHERRRLGAFARRHLARRRSY
jgi:hypothetical protein